MLRFRTCTYENGQPAEDVAKRYFTDKSKDAESKKAEPLKSPATKPASAKKQIVKVSPKKAAKKTGKKI